MPLTSQAHQMLFFPLVLLLLNKNKQLISMETSWSRVQGCRYPRLPLKVFYPGLSVPGGGIQLTFNQGGLPTGCARHCSGGGTSL